MNSPRSILLSVPALSLVAATLCLALFAMPRAVVGVRVTGGPTEGVGPHVLHLTCVRHETGEDDLVPLDRLRVTLASAAGGSVERATACGAEGTAELEIPADVVWASPLTVTVARAPSLLAHAQVTVTVDAWKQQTQERPAELAAVAGQGRLWLDGGAMVIGQPSMLYLETFAAGSFATTQPRAEAFGADLSPVQAVDRGWSVTVTPTFFAASVTWYSTSSNEEFLTPPALGTSRATLTQPLPLVPGAATVTALSLAPPYLRATLCSALDRPMVHAWLQDDNATRAYRAVALTHRDDGERCGELTIEPVWQSPIRRAWLVVANDPDLASSSAVGWPLPPHEGSLLGPFRRGRIVRDTLWVDGLPAQRAAEKQRRTRGRNLAFGCLLTGAVLTTFLLLRRVRAASATMHEAAEAPEIAAALGLETTRNQRTLALALLCVWLGFAIITLVLAVGLR